jgi:hypothetical protein
MPDQSQEKTPVTRRKKKTIKKSVEKPEKVDNLQEEFSDNPEDVPVSANMFPDLNGRLIHIAIGDKERPATEQDITDLEEQMEGLMNRYKVDCMVLVTHHAVRVEVIC